MSVANVLKSFRSLFTNNKNTNVRKRWYSNVIENRPISDDGVFGSDVGAKVRNYPVSLKALYDIADNIDIVRIIIGSLIREMFKNGLEIVSRWKFKCGDCGKEYGYEPDLNGDVACDECGSLNILTPDIEGRRKLEYWLYKKVNSSGKSLIDILQQVERDLDIVDNAYILSLKSYDIDEGSGMIVDEKIEEFIRVSPLAIELIADESGRLGYVNSGNEAKKGYVCPLHREEIGYESACARCGTQCLEVVARANVSGMQWMYYGKSELIYTSKYKQGDLYGYSPLFAVWNKVMTLYYMDIYLMKYFSGMRPPKGLLIVGGRNFESLRKAWDTLRDKIKENPHAIYPLMVETEKSGAPPVMFVDLMRNLSEMQFIEARNEYRRTIGALYGVLPLFAGDLPTGWSNENLQVAITNRAIEWGHKILIDKILTKICDALGVYDWLVVFRAGEVTDELRELQLKAQELRNVETMSRLGYLHKIDNNGKFVFSQEPLLDPRLTGEGKLSERSPVGNTEGIPPLEGMEQVGRPSDEGGQYEGGYGSGSGTSLSEKSEDEDDVITAVEKALEDIEKVDRRIYTNKMIQGLYRGNFAGYNRTDSTAIRNVMRMAIKNNFPKREIYRLLKTSFNMDNAQAKLIVDTEVEHFVNKTRAEYFGNSSKKIIWRVKDENACPMCKELAERTANGVTIDEMRDMIREIVLKNGKRQLRHFILHPRDRCRVVSK